MVSVYCKLKLGNGASLFTNTKIWGIKRNNSIIEIFINAERITTENLLITVGKETNDALSLLKTEVPLMHKRKAFSWVHADEGIYNNSVFPAWNHNDENSIYYGFSSIKSMSMKIGRHDGGIPIHMKD